MKLISLRTPRYMSPSTQAWKEGCKSGFWLGLATGGFIFAAIYFLQEVL